MNRPSRGVAGLFGGGIKEVLDARVKSWLEKRLCPIMAPSAVVRGPLTMYALSREQTSPHG